MSLTLENVAKVARLARIHYSDADLALVGQELNGIIPWINKLQEVNTDGVQNFTDCGDISMPERSDIICDGNYVEQILKNAPESAHNMFAVPKVVE